MAPTNDQPLIWATRPAAQNAGWCKRLESLGYASVAAPLLAIEPVTGPAEQQAIKQCILALDEYQVLIFVSQNAVAYGREWIERFWPQWPVQQTVLAIGEKTRAALADAVADVISPPGMDSEALLALPQLREVAGGKVLILRGLGGLPTLAETLRAAGATVHLCELYHRCPCVPDGNAAQALKRALAAGQVLVPVFSGETLSQLTQVLTLWQCLPAEVPVLVPGNRVAEVARDQGYQTIFIAANASEQAMLTRLTQARDDNRTAKGLWHD